MNNFLVAIAVFLIAVISAAFAVPRIVHWENYRGVIEEEATRLIGRDVRVGGAVRISLLPSPTFSIGKVRIADVEANTGEPFFQADAIHGRLAIAPLLRGSLQASEVVLDKPQLHLVLDNQGGGNWRTLGGNGGSLPFQVSDVALESVKITNGGLAVFGSDRLERVRLVAIDGLLSAQALDGPFRFRGTFGSDGQKRDLRFSTSRQEVDGSIRFKAALHQTDTGATYNFDARAIDLTKSPRVEGELSAKVSLPVLTGPQQTTGKPSADAKGDPDAPVEVKAALSADLKLVKLANLSLSFERFGRPQILTGDASIDLGNSVTLDTRLAAKWLDLDQVIGMAPAPGQEATFKPTRGPIEGLLTLAQRLNGFTPDEGRTRLALDVEQANLGQEAVSGLRLVVEGKGAETDIRELRLGLPGGSQADVKGLMTGSGEETSFSGDVALRGSSLTRFLAWASAGSLGLDPARDGAFSMRSRVSTSPGNVVAREFTGELAGTIMQGELGYRWQGRPEVSVLIEGPRVDLRTIWGGDASASQSLVSYLAAGANFGAQTGKTDAVLRVRAGELLLPGAMFIDTAADLEVRDGRVRVSQLRLAADHGITLDIEGDVPASSSTDRATLRGTATAASAEGTQKLLDLLAVPASARPAPADLAALAPIRLAGIVTYGAAAGSRVDVSVDGSVGGTRVAGKAWLDRGLNEWRTARLDSALTLRGANAVALLQRLGGSTSNAKPAPYDPATAVVLNIAGVPSTGLVAEASVIEGGKRLSYQGRATLDTKQGLGLDGNVEIDGAGSDRLLSLITRRRIAMPAAPVTGRARVERAGNRVALDGIVAKVGGAQVRGALAVDADDALTGRIVTSELPAATLIEPLLSQGAQAQSRTGAVWPTASFIDKALADVTGDFTIDADRLTLPSDVALLKTSMTLVLRPGRVEVRDLRGVSGGGTWTGAGRLDSGADGGALTMALRVQELQPAHIRPATAGAPVPVQSSLSGALSLTGKGATPHDLIANASGRGSFAQSEARLGLLGPSDLVGLIQETLRTGGEQWAATLRQQLSAFTPKPASSVVLPARSIDVEVKNGTISMAPVGAETADGKVQGALAVDLTAMAVNGTWRVEAAGDLLPPPPGWTTTVTPSGAAVQKPRPPPLPPIAITWTASLGALNNARSTYSTEALEREVSVRKVERDLEDLERLRKLDEERAKEELERRRLLEPSAAPGGPGQAGSAPITALTVDPSTDATAVPDTVDPSLRPRPAPPATVAPAPKPAYRPLSIEEQRAIFNKQ